MGKRRSRRKYKDHVPRGVELPEELFQQVIDENGEPLKRKFPDERFFGQRGYKQCFYVSQYNTVIREFDRAGRHQVELYNISYGKNGYGRVSMGRLNHHKHIHRMVAEIWCLHPSFDLKKMLPEATKDDVELHAHHLYPVSSNVSDQPENINWAENLIWVYARYHKTIEPIQCIEAKLSNQKVYNTYRTVEQVAKDLKVKAFYIYEMLRNEKGQDITENPDAEIRIISYTAALPGVVKGTKKVDLRVYKRARRHSKS